MVGRLFGIGHHVEVGLFGVLCAKLEVNTGLARLIRQDAWPNQGVVLDRFTLFIEVAVAIVDRVGIREAEAFMLLLLPLCIPK